MGLKTSQVIDYEEVGDVMVVFEAELLSDGSVAHNVLIKTDLTDEIELCAIDKKSAQRGYKKLVKVLKEIQNLD